MDGLLWKGYARDYLTFAIASATRVRLGGASGYVSDSWREKVNISIFASAVLPLSNALMRRLTVPAMIAANSRPSCVGRA